MTTFNSSLFIKLIISLTIPLALGSVAGMFTAQAVPEWFASLNKPEFNPPNWVFGPVWTTLYLIMGISFFMIWQQKPGRIKKQAIVIYFTQLILNFAWSFLFFYYNFIGFALIEIGVLWISILFMILKFYPLNRTAALVNIPYLLWVSFATFLNAAYFLLN